MITIIVNRTEKHKIKKSNVLYKLIDDLCWKSKNLYNYGNYIIKQEFIKTSKEKECGLRENANWIRYNELYHIVKDSEPYRDFGGNIGQSTLRKLDKNWKSYFASIKEWSKNPEKYKGIPKTPQYLQKENGRYECDLPNNRFKIVDGYIFFCWKPLKVMNNTFKTKIQESSKLIQLRFVPKNSEYIMEVVYEVEIPDIDNGSSRIAAIDLGVDKIGRAHV